MKNILSGAVLATFINTAVANTTETQDRDVINNLTNNIILKNYHLLDKDLLSLKQRIKQYQAAPHQENLIQLQQAWRKSRIGFEIAETHLFGPVVSLGIDPALDSWPLNKTQLALTIEIASQLSGEKLQLFTDSLNDDVSGFHAIEYLIFGDNNDLQPAALDEPKLAYLLLLTNKMQDKINELNQSWLDKQDGFAQALQLQHKKTYSNTAVVMQEFVNGMITIINEVGTGKLIDPLGDSLANPAPELVESQFSWNSTEDFFWNLVGVWQFWTGTNATVSGLSGTGLQQAVAQRNPELAKKVTNLIQQSLKDIVAISYHQPFPDTLDMNDIQELKKLINQSDYKKSFKYQVQTAEGRQRVRQAEKTLDALQATLEDDILPLF